jgi:hypothetical protein
LNFDVTVRKLKSARLCPLESRQMFSSAGTMGLMSVPAWVGLGWVYVRSWAGGGNGGVSDRAVRPEAPPSANTPPPTHTNTHQHPSHTHAPLDRKPRLTKSPAISW